MTSQHQPLQFSYDEQRDVLTIHGTAYSGDLFRAWGRHGIPTGTHFRLIARTEDGVITIERIADPGAL